ncbi:copia protein [Tanacetum coccineum]
MHADELHKFSNGTLDDVRSALNDIAKGIRMEYLPMRKWSNLDKKRARVMVQDIDKQLYQRRLMRNLENQNQRDLPRDILLDSVVVLRYEKRSKSENKGRVQTEVELVLEQTQQGTSYEVSICLGVDLEPDEWIKDSGCSKHMTGNQKLFSSYKAYNGGNVIFGSNLRGNIIGKGRGIRKKGLCVIKLGNKPKDQICLATIDENSTLWHRRLGHSNMRLIQSLASKELVRNLPKLKFDQHFCDACKIRKQAHASHKTQNIVSTTRCLELLHMDLFGPSAVRSYGGKRYTLVIVYDYSRKVEESLNVTFDETPSPSKTSTLVDDDLDEEEAIKLVLQPRNMRIIRTKWVFRNKLDENGIVSQNKARLVAQGYNQQEGIDYDETYALVARLESIRILLAYACALDFKLFQMDVKSAFLNGFINEETSHALSARCNGCPQFFNSASQKDCGMRRGASLHFFFLHFGLRESGQPSSSHLNDDDDGNGERTSHASTPYHIRFVNSLTNDVPQVLQNSPNIDPHMKPFYNRQI